MDYGAADQALLAQIASGDRAALEALYRRHSGWITARLQHRCADIDLVDTAVQDTFLAAWRGAVETGHPYDAEARLRRADGVYCWFHTHGFPLRDRDGRIVLWYLLRTDVDDRKRAEERLRQSEAYLSEAQRLSHTGSFGWSVATGEIIWSDETFRIFQYDRTTKPTVELIVQRTHPEDRALLRQTIERMLDAQ